MDFKSFITSQSASTCAPPFPVRRVPASGQPFPNVLKFSLLQRSSDTDVSLWWCLVIISLNYSSGMWADRVDSMFKSRDGAQSLGQGGLLLFFFFFISVFPSQSDWSSFATVETLVWLGTREGPLGPSVGRLGEGPVKSTPLWGGDTHIKVWWTLNTNCSPVDIQGQGSYCETRIRSASGKLFKWKWNQIMSRGFLVDSPRASAVSPSRCNWLWQNATGDMQLSLKWQRDHVARVS